MQRAIVKWSGADAGVLTKKGVLNVTWPQYSRVVTIKEGYAELVSPPTALRYLVPVKKYEAG